MAYLQDDDLEAFDVADAKPSDVLSASVLLDAYLQRPEGLLWAPDGSGWPCYMAGLSPTLTLTAPGAISAGANVVVSIAGMTYPDLIGDVLILDRATPAKTEACVVTAITPTSVTLQGVKFAHDASCAMDVGLVILEERALPANRSVSRVSRSPVARMVAVQGRYAYGRRSQQQAGIFAEPSILSSVQVFGGPPAWYPVDINHVSISQSSGEVWIPAGALLANFSDVRMRYVAGYPVTAIPAPLKRACAVVVRQMRDFPELSGNMKSLSSGGSKIERFADTLLDAETRATLVPFAARSFF